VKSSFAIFFLASSLCYAQSELHSKAVAETQVEKVAVNSATDAQVNGPANESVLKLDDTGDVNVKRSYDWVFGVKFQNFQPSGKMTSADKSGVYLSDISSFYLPSLEFGIRKLGNETKTSVWHWDVLGHVGYANQKSVINLASPTEDPEARLTTLLYDLTFAFDYELADSNWGLDAGLGYGNLSYSHSGNSSFSQFSEQAAFRSASVGAHYNARGNWQILGNYVNRNLMDEDSRTINMPTDSLELGTRLVW
jgi:hypothetical protein